MSDENDVNLGLTSLAHAPCSFRQAKNTRSDWADFSALLTAQPSAATTIYYINASLNKKPSCR